MSSDDIFIIKPDRILTMTETHDDKLIEIYKNYLEDEDDRVGYNLGISGPIPSYSLINLSSSYQLSQKMKLFLTGKNITDEIYIGSRLHSNPGQKDANISSGILPGARRQINLGLEYTF